MFENLEIPIEDLPSLAGLDWQPLEPAYRSRLLVDRLITIGFMAAGLVFLATVAKIPQAAIAALGAGAVMAAIVMLIWPFIALPRMGYVVRDRDLVFRSGVLFRQVTAVPYNRIQHVETSSSPLDRRFTLATLKVYTAGGSGSDLKIDGLGAERAEQLRGLVLDKAGASIESD
jgi:membrane protein YdbS with pleckstrin-like domain